MAAPRRSNRQQQHQQQHMGPSPIVEYNQIAPPHSHPASMVPQQQPKGQTLVVYHLDQIPTPFAMRVPGSNITLADFKAKVLKRPGNFRCVCVCVFTLK